MASAPEPLPCLAIKIASAIAEIAGAKMRVLNALTKPVEISEIRSVSGGVDLCVDARETISVVEIPIDPWALMERRLSVERVCLYIGAATLRFKFVGRLVGGAMTMCAMVTLPPSASSSARAHPSALC